MNETNCTSARFFILILLSLLQTSLGIGVQQPFEVAVAVIHSLLECWVVGTTQQTDSCETTVVWVVLAETVPCKGRMPEYTVEGVLCASL